MAIKSVSLSKLGGDFQISENFKLREFACKDGSDIVKYSTGLLALLETLRAYGGFTITVNSGYRTASYNSKIGGASLSQHINGTAADICVKKDGKPVDARLICCLCQTLGFKGIGYISKTALHVDDRASGTYRGDERKGYRGNVGNDFYSYFGITKAQVEALKVKPKPETPKKEAEAEVMTQQQFNQMMNRWISEQAAKEPGEWSKEDREWAEKNGIIKGTGAGYSYLANCTREQMVAFLHRLFDLMNE